MIPLLRERRFHAPGNDAGGPCPDPRANPLAGNPLATKHDLQQAVVDLVEPVVRHLSPGGARARLGSFGSAFAPRVAELEGYARPLWGIVPLVAGGGTFPYWERWVAGLRAGTDPEHPEYWGACGAAVDQRMVEMAAIGFALAFTPEHLWDPLAGRDRDRVIAWLRGIEAGEPAPNNWQFFRLLVQAGLERVGAAVDTDARARSVALIDTFATEHGWYTDGAGGNVDYYVAFAFHTYGLILAASGLGDRDAAARWVERARCFAVDFQHWFAADGAALPFGRSLTYRFAQASLWGALALADVDALDWAVVRGLALRHLRWWSERPISDRDGVLSVGYGYDNRAMSESYSSAGSPYWCTKAFAMLAAADDHPFWTAAEAEPAPPAVVTLAPAGMVLGRDPGQVVALVGQEGGWRFAEQAEAKYEKFAYSSRFGFSGDFPLRFGTPVTDSVLAVSDPATGERRVRSASVLTEVGDGVVLARWHPLPGVRVDTALAGGAPWHVRVHRVATGRALALTETGFGLPVDPEDVAAGPFAGGTGEEWAASVSAASAWGATTIVDRPASDRVRGVVRAADLRVLPPNAHVLHPHAVVPALEATVEAGVHWLGCAVGASHDPAAVALEQAPAIPASLVARLEEFAARPGPDSEGEAAAP